LAGRVIRVPRPSPNARGLLTCQFCERHVDNYRGGASYSSWTISTPGSLVPIGALIKNREHEKMKEMFFSKPLAVWEHLSRVMYWENPVRSAIRHGNPTALKFFLSKGLWDPHFTPLLFACEKAHRIGCVKILLDHPKTDLKLELDESGFRYFGVSRRCWRDPRGGLRALRREYTALHLACKSGSLAIVRLLVRAGAEVNMMPPKSRVPEWWTQDTRKLPWDTIHTSHFETPLMVAARHGRTDVVEFLLRGPRGESRVDKLVALWTAGPALPDAYFSDALVREVAEFVAWPFAVPTIRNSSGEDALSLAKGDAVKALLSTAIRGC